MPKVQTSLLRGHAINRNNIILPLKIATILFGTIAFFFNDLYILFSDALTSEVTSYILIVPFIFAFMIYRKRKMLKAVTPLNPKTQSKKLEYFSAIAGTLLFVTSILIYWHGSYTFTPLEYHLVALPVFVAGLVLLFFNLQTLRETIFPIIFLLFLTPPPAEILYNIGATLSSISSEISNAIVQLIGIPSTLVNQYESPLIIITRPDGMQLNFTVDIACSGIYSLMGFMIFAILLTYLIRDKPWKKLGLIFTGVIIITLLNIIRITVILAIGYNFGENLALQVFHLLGGWVLTFLGTLLLLFVSEKIFKATIFEGKKAKCPECVSEPQNQKFCYTCGRNIKHKKFSTKRSDILKVASAIAVIVLFLSIQAPVFAMSKGPADILVNTPSGQTETTTILPLDPNYVIRFAYRDTAFEELAQQDLSIAYIYSPRDPSLDVLWVTMEIASTRSPLHRWETCLVNYPLSQGWKVTVVQLELEDVQLAENPPVIGRYFIFENASSTQIQSVLYWYESAIFEVGSASEQKTMKVSVIGYPDNPQELQSIKEQQLAIAKSLVEYWEPIKLWSAVTMVISKNGGYLSIATTSLLVVIAGYYLFEKMKKQKTNHLVYTKLSRMNKEFVDAIISANKEKNSTLHGIRMAYQESTGQEITEEKLLEKLCDLEKERIIERQLSNKKDEPTTTWKA